MKIKGAKQVHYDAGPNMTPLVDVVMVILIFMMLAGSFGANEHYLMSSVPITKGGGGGDKSKVPDTTEFRITVDSQGGRFVARAGDEESTDADQLTQLLKTRLAQFKATGTPIDKVQVVISPGRTVQYMYLLAVYQSALDAQFTKVAFESMH